MFIKIKKLLYETGIFLMNNEIMWVQRTKKVVSDSPGLVNFAIEL